MYKPTFNLNFNEDCASPGFYIADFFQSGEVVIDANPKEGITITRVTIKYYKEACAKDCASPLVSYQVVSSDFLEEDFLSLGVFTEEGLFISNSGSISKITIELEYTEDGVEKTSSSSKCVFIPCCIVCKLVDSLIANPKNVEYVHYFDSIKLAIECNNCCVACSLYNNLLSKINNKNCKSCN
jgi:hypothetical protein